MVKRDPFHVTEVADNQLGHRSMGLLALAAVMAMGLMLSGCNTAAGVGKDVSATGTAVTRGANDVKQGL